MSDKPEADNTGQAPDSMEAIKADIASTRAELEETVNELTDRLSPKYQLHQATAAVADKARQSTEQTATAAKKGVEQVQRRARSGVAQIQPPRGGKGVPIAIAALVVTAAAVLLWRRRGR